jgi:hypothetical protein
MAPDKTKIAKALRAKQGKSKSISEDAIGAIKLAKRRPGEEVYFVENGKPRIAIYRDGSTEIKDSQYDRTVLMRREGTPTPEDPLNFITAPNPMSKDEAIRSGASAINQGLLGNANVTSDAKSALGLNKVSNKLPPDMGVSQTPTGTDPVPTRLYPDRDQGDYSSNVPSLIKQKTVTTSEQKGIPISRNIKDDIEKQRAEIEKGRIESKESRERIAQGYEDQEFSAAAEELKAEAEGVELGSKIEEEEKRLANITKTIDEWKLDPNSYWNNLGIGQRILMILGMAAGAAGQAIDPRMKNYAVEEYHRQVDLDLQAQKADYQNKLRRAGMSEKKIQFFTDRYDKTEATRRQQLNLQQAAVIKAQIARDPTEANRIYQGALNEVTNQAIKVNEQEQGKVTTQVQIEDIVNPQIQIEKERIKQLSEENKLSQAQEKFLIETASLESGAKMFVANYKAIKAQRGNKGFVSALADRVGSGLTLNTNEIGLLNGFRTMEAYAIGAIAGQTGKSVAEKELKEFRNIAQNYLDKPAVLKAKLTRLRDGTINRIDAQRDMYKSLGNETMYRVLSEKRNAINSIFKEALQ